MFGVSCPLWLIATVQSLAVLSVLSTWDLTELGDIVGILAERDDVNPYEQRTYVTVKLVVIFGAIRVGNPT